MSILITGIAGHIGSNVARMLIEEGEKVVGVDVARPGPHTVIAGMEDRYSFHAGSVADLSLLLAVMKEHRVGRVLHTAVVQAEFANARPIEAIRVNIEGTQNVIEAAKLLELKKVVCCSSSSAGGEHQGRPLDQAIEERDIDWPVPSIYALTKVSIEGLVALAHRLYGVDAIACRPSRVWGPGYARFDIAPPVELLLHRAMAGEPIRLENGGDTGIDYTYVKDLAKGFIQALRSGKTESTVFNLSTGRLVSLFEVGKVMQQSFPDLEISIGPGELDMSAFTQGAGRSYRVAVRPALDVSRAKREFGYAPRFGIENGIADYVAWLRDRRY